MILLYYVNFIKFQLLILLVVASSLFLFIDIGASNSMYLCSTQEYTEFVENIFMYFENNNNLYEYVKNVSYSLVAAQIFYIFTVGIPGAYANCRHAKIFLISLSKIISIVEKYSKEFLNRYNINECNELDLNKIKNYKSNSKIFSMEEFNFLCIRIDSGYEDDFKCIKNFVDTMKYKFMHHYNEVVIMSKSVDDDVLSSLFELKSALDGINRVNHINFNKVSELCAVLGNVTEKATNLARIVDKKYFFLAKALK